MSEQVRGKPMKLSIQVETHDSNLVSNLFESARSISGQTQKTISEEVTMRFEGLEVSLAIDVPSIITATLYIGEHVALPIAVTVLSRYLYDKLRRRRDNKLRINGTQVEINAEKIEQLIIVNLKEG